MSTPVKFYERDGITIYHGDARDILPTIAPGSVDLVLTDPPYQSLDVEVTVGTTTRLVGLDQLAGKRLAALGGRAWFETLPAADIIAAIQFGQSLLKPTGATYVFADVKSGLELFPLLDPANVIVWDKLKLGMGYNWRRMHEWIAFIPQPDHKLRNQGRGDIIRCNGVGEKSHPTEKPTGVLQSLILNSTDKDDLIINPFMGTGSLLVAASKLGRRAIGIDINEDYCITAYKRLQQTAMNLEIPA